jgi:LacI family transcriptional regulator
LATSREVAEVAGVSPATVSRVLNGSDKVSLATRQRVLDAMNRVGYRPNAAARRLRTQRTGTIGVVISDITNPFYPQLVEALTAALDEADQHVILWNSAFPGEDSAVRAVRERSVDGIIFATVVEGSRPLEEALSLGEPVVLLNRTIDGAPCDQVATDNVAGGRLIAEYLHHHGHERIAYIAGPPLPSTSRQREAGFVGRLAELGAALPDERLLRGQYTHDAGRQAMRQLLSLAERPTAVACANDVVAFGALSAARSMNVAVPRDVWVVGFDDIPMAGWDSFDLTTIRQPIHDMARAAVDLLLERIEDRSLPPRFVGFPNGLVVRGSTSHAPLPDPSFSPSGVRRRAASPGRRSTTKSRSAAASAAPARTAHAAP